MSKLTLQQLDAGIDAALVNASSLIEEAKLLFHAGFHARAYALSHIAREELAKVTMLYTSGLRMQAEHSVNWSKLHKRLRDHKSKLTSDALASFVSAPGAADKIQLEKLLAGSSTRNEWKNDSLYIAFKEQSFKTPSEMITLKKAERTIALAVFAFEDTKRYLSGGGKLTERDPKSAREIFRSIDPDKLEASNALDLIKELAKLVHAAAKSQEEQKTERTEVVDRSTDNDDAV
jgi:AbiV family abortive infection protein